MTTLDETQDYSWALNFLGDINWTIALIKECSSKVQSFINYDDQELKKNSEGLSGIFKNSWIGRLAWDMSRLSIDLETDIWFWTKISTPFDDIQMKDLPSPNSKSG